MNTKDIKTKSAQIKKMKTMKIIEVCISLLVIILAIFLYYRGYDPTVVLIYFAGKNLYTVVKKKNTTKNYRFMLILNVAGLFLGLLGAYDLIQQLIK